MSKFIRPFANLVIITMVSTILVACEQKLDLSDEELAARMAECQATKDEDKTPGMAVACGNYMRECQRRGKETGNYFC